MLLILTEEKIWAKVKNSWLPSSGEWGMGDGISGFAPVQWLATVGTVGTVEWDQWGVGPVGSGTSGQWEQWGVGTVGSG